MYRVVCNEALRHLQWIVVRDSGGRPEMVAGPFGDAEAAYMHCDALNRQPAPTPVKSRGKEFHWILDPALAIRLAALGWIGSCRLHIFPPRPEQVN